jgi:hypothetical protein
MGKVVAYAKFRAYAKVCAYTKVHAYTRAYARSWRLGMPVGAKLAPTGGLKTALWCCNYQCLDDWCVKMETELITYCTFSTSF